MDLAKGRRMNAVGHMRDSVELVTSEDLPEMSLRELGALLGRLIGVVEEIARDVRILAEGYERDRSSILRERGGHYPSRRADDPA